MLIKIYRGETNCSLAGTQSMGQKYLHDYEYSWACGVSVHSLVRLRILPGCLFAKRRDEAVFALGYAEMFQEHLTNKAFLLTCCWAELEQYESTIMLKSYKPELEHSSWSKLGLCSFVWPILLRWLDRRGGGWKKVFQKWLELLIAVGLTMKNPPWISGIKVTAVYSTDVSDEKQGLLKMKGQDRKLSPACSASSSLGADKIWLLWSTVDLWLQGRH